MGETEKGFDMDLMSTSASAHVVPDKDRRLPFYSRHRTKGCAGVDVLNQDVGRLPVLQKACFGLCFPPTAMVGRVLQRMAEWKARAVVVVPDKQLTWFPQ